MEATEVRDTSPAADVEASLPATSEESASQATEPTTEQISASMNALLRGQIAQTGPSSKPDAADAGDADTEAISGESAPTGDVKPPSAPGRRMSAAEIKRLSDENERLTKALAEVNPPPPDPSEEARKSAIERETRFRRLLLKPDTDQDWTTDDYEFVQSEKARRSVAPELQQHYETVLEADRTSLRQWADTTLEQRWNAIKADLSATLVLPGVTDEVKAQLLAAPLSEQVLIHRRLERESVQQEMTKLREELAQAKRELYGSARAPLNSGRSSPGRTYDGNTVMNTLIRGRRA